MSPPEKNERKYIERETYGPAMLFADNFEWKGTFLNIHTDFPRKFATFDRLRACNIWGLS